MHYASRIDVASIQLQDYLNAAGRLRREMRGKMASVIGAFAGIDR